MTTGASRTQLGEYNIKTVIHALRRLGPSSQGDVAAQAGLSVQAVSVILRRLAERGMVRELRAESIGRGRPRIILDLVPEAAYSIGVHIDPALVTAVLLDLHGRPLQTEHCNQVDPTDPHATMDVAAGLVHRLTNRSRTTAEGVVGSALAVPGRIEPGVGAISDSVWLPQWNHVPVAELLEQRIGMRVPLLKDTFAAISGEIWVRGPALLEATAIFVYLGIGTGLGLAMNGHPMSGQSGNAGQAGRLFELLAHHGEDSRSTADGATAHDPVELVRVAHARGLLDGPPPERADIRTVDTHFRALCHLAAEGDPTALELLHGAAARIHRMTATVADVLDAGCVVLGGPYWDLLRGTHLPDAHHAIERSARRGQMAVTVMPSALGTDAGAIGAASYVLDRHFSPRP